MAYNDFPYNDRVSVLAPAKTKGIAWAGCLDGEGRDWWYYLEVDYMENETGKASPVTSTETIWANRHIDVGTVIYDPGQNTLTISLKGGWSLSDISEPVKIQGYNKIPKNTPGTGLLNSYRGKDTRIEIPPHRYYVIHLDVQLCQ
ncbi:MAG TPA: hypothetical protein ENH59_00855 [Bacteroidetes bacterium]|nr:hypothetical protein [Bacteroidota bacterium]